MYDAADGNICVELRNAHHMIRKNPYFCRPHSRRGARVVEEARLESVYTVKGIKGSNPFLSASKDKEPLNWGFFIAGKHPS